ncbi:MAG: polysaccharide deacetylase family protein [Bacteroidia bacterium]|nr:polysaccharide deacetylase family protein [Bacteroidia bacterium]
MIRILIPAHSPRISYTLELIFARILGIAYEIVPLNSWHSEPGIPVINYTQLILPDAFSIPNAGLLRQTDTAPVDIRIATREIPYLFHFSASGSSYHLEFDVFSAVFYLATDYEKQVDSFKDIHDRYDPALYPSTNWGLESQPLVHLYCEKLWEKISRHYPQLIHKPPVFDYCITWDIDFPWKYFHKDASTHIGGFFRDIKEGKWKRLAERSRAWLTGKDPNYTFEQIFSLSPKEKTLFFFLIDRNSEHDSRFTWENPHLQQLIKTISQKGYTAGIHPSYSSYLDPVRIQNESRHLHKIIGKPVTYSRQHFLRYQLPDTFRYLLDAGIEADFTLCRFKGAGFPCGMAIPFPWYDLEKNQTSRLMLWPSIAMDRTLQKYMTLGADEAVSHLRMLLETTRRYHGIFTLLLHNDVLSESEEWKGWRKPIKAFLQELVG